MTSSSSTSSSRRCGPVRPLGVGWVAAVILLATVALNAGVARYVEQPPDVVTAKIRGYRARPPGPHIVSFGSCHGDAFVPQAVEAAWGAGVRVINVSFKNTEPMEWALIFRRYIEEDPDLVGVAVVFANTELRIAANPWEEQVMGLASWGDIPLLARVGCKTFGCAGELVLRRAWPAYRQRGYLSARVWHSVGVRPPSLPPGSPKPGKSESSWFDGTPDPYVWARAFLAEAHRRDIPAWFIPLAPNPEFPPADKDLASLAVIREGGGVVLDIAVDPPLTAADYKDDRHLKDASQPRMAQAIGKALRVRMPTGR